jgi:hypothetical protein
MTLASPIQSERIRLTIKPRSTLPKKKGSPLGEAGPLSLTVVGVTSLK